VECIIHRIDVSADSLTVGGGVLSERVLCVWEEHVIPVTEQVEGPVSFVAQTLADLPQERLKIELIVNMGLVALAI
jgi:hypothetical protein